MEQDEFYMMKAIEIAKGKIRGNEYPFGCCIVYQDMVILESNSCFTSRNPLNHAEMNAMNQLINLYGEAALKKSVLYATTEPCLMCLGAINWAHVPRVVYGTSIAESSRLGFDEIDISIDDVLPKMHYSLEVKGGVLHEECMNLLAEWHKRNEMIKRLFKIRNEN